MQTYFTKKNSNTRWKIQNYLNSLKSIITKKLPKEKDPNNTQINSDKYSNIKDTMPKRSKSKKTYSRSKKQSKNTNKKLLFFTYLTSIALAAVIFGTVIMIATFAFYSRDLPNPNQLLERSDELSTKLYDKNDEPIFEVYGEKNRSIVKIDDIAQPLLDATLAVEDANFYNHQGFYFLGMLRAVKNTLLGQGLQGGSTLTQQVVKNAVLTQERTIVRKVKEFILALQLENKYSKEQILQMYLNETPYGGQNYGALTAAKAYFNKHPRDLTVAEAAYLAGLPQSPSRYSYYSSNPELGLERKNYVLYLMNEKGWVGADGKRHFLGDEDYEKAKEEELKFQPGRVSFQAPHFVFYVKEVLSEMFGEEMVEQGGLQVKTTLDLDLQKKAEEIVKEEIEKAAYLNVGNGALVAIEPSTGNILAMVGSKDYFAESEPTGCVSSCTFDPNVNVATSLRQPGSSIKPITYATMLSQGYTPAFPFLDVQTKFQGESPDKPYVPENYDGIFRGPMSLRKSLGNSLNIPAVKALQIVGIDNMLEMAQNLGITTLTQRDRYGLALTLGGGETKLVEMTGAFATFANKGVHMAPTPIIEVKDANGNVLYTNKPVGKRVVSEEVAFQISDILSDDGARSEVFGFGSLLNIPNHKVSVKTGTTDDLRDNYALGYTPSIAVGVWVGNNNNEPMSKVASGVTGATPVWNRFMVEYLSGKEPEKIEPPENVKKVIVDELTGMLPYDDNDQRPEWFIKGTEPTAVSDWYTRLEICKEDGLLANDECKKADKTKVETFIDVEAELPQWQVYVDKWIGENFSGKEEYFPPTIKSGLDFDDDGDVKKDTAPVVGISHFSSGDVVPLEFRLNVEVSSANDIDAVRIYLDGEQVTKDESKPFGYNFTFAPDQVGTRKFRAKATDEDGREGETEIELKVVGYSLD